ncbi:MAG: hypothetical protein KY453_09720, partial [Gemmatimonadetes bacterium]|nr:hypothetical protein [Gemmatimonadota bacterium]
MSRREGGTSEAPGGAPEAAARPGNLGSRVRPLTFHAHAPGEALPVLSPERGNGRVPFPLPQAGTPVAAGEVDAAELARRLAAGPGVAHRLTKRALRASPGNDLAAQLALEAELQAEAGRSRDFMEGVMAFLEKRAARFEGR